MLKLYTEDQIAEYKKDYAGYTRSRLIAVSSSWAYVGQDAIKLFNTAILPVMFNDRETVQTKQNRGEFLIKLSFLAWGNQLHNFSLSQFSTDCPIISETLNQHKNMILYIEKLIEIKP